MTKADKRARKKENHAKARAAAAAAAKKQDRLAQVKRLGVLLGVVAIALALFVWINGDDGDDTEVDAGGTSTTVPIDTSTSTTTDTSTPEPFNPELVATASIETSEGTIVLELDPAAAPLASARFFELASDGFYDGLTFHRVVDGFMIQGGDPNGDGTGGAGSTVVGEVPTDNYPIGSLAAAKSSSDPAGTFDSQFFIVTGARGATLPNDYARFGKVVEGLDVAQKIAALETAGTETPSKPVTIVSVTVSQDEPTNPTTTTAATDE